MLNKLYKKLSVKDKKRITKTSYLWQKDRRTGED